MFVSSTIHAEEKSIKVTQVQIAQWHEGKNGSELKTNPAEIQLYHNNGNPIKTNTLEPSPKTDLYLFAISNYYVNNVSYRDYYFSEANTDNIETVQQETTRTLEQIMKSPSYNTDSIQTIRNYHYSLSTGATLTTNIEFERENSNVNINGTTGSVWNVKAAHTIKNTIINPPFISWNTQLSVPYSSQLLIDFKSDPTMLPTNFFSNLTGFNINNDSSLSEKTGSWTLKKNLFNPVPKTAQMNTEIRTSNTSGNLGLQLSHTYIRAGDTTHSTGIISTYIPDR